MVLEILSTAKLFVGESLSPEEEDSLTRFCHASLKQWRAKLLPSAAPEDCAEALISACALYGAAGFLLVKATEAASFSVGDVSVRTQQIQTVVDCFNRQAEALLRPYVQDLNFVCMGVRG